MAATKYEQGVSLMDDDDKVDDAIETFANILADEPSSNDDVDVDALRKTKEQAIYRLGEAYTKKGDGEALGNLLKESRPFFAELPKARTAKIVRSLIDLVARVPDSLALQVQLCLESIEWATQEKRTFLRQRIGMPKRREREKRRKKLTRKKNGKKN
jgi:26S proteasome regulatory subunit N6